MGQYGHASASLNVPVEQPKERTPLGHCLDELQGINARLHQLLSELDDGIVRLSGNSPAPNVMSPTGTISAVPDGTVAKLADEVGRLNTGLDRLAVIRDRLRNV